MNYADYLSRFHDTTVLVVGDILLDEYLFSNVNRISPEAPVQVCLIKNRTWRLGGSANVANNIAALGGKSIPVGVIGNDDNGKKTLELFVQQKISTDGILIDKKRPTTTKTRIMAHNQQLLRLDAEDCTPLSPSLNRQTIQVLEELAPRAGAIILEDYGKGMISRSIILKAIEVAKKYEIPILVDPKVENFKLYKDITLMTPNHHEASQGAGIRITNEASLLKAGRKLLSILNMKALLITQGSEGMTLFESNGNVSHIPTLAREVFDVTGAGDTVISLMGMCLAINPEDFYKASMISNVAAGIVVGKIGTATVSPAELMEKMKSHHLLEESAS